MFLEIEESEESLVDSFSMILRQTYTTSSAYEFLKITFDFDVYISTNVDNLYENQLLNSYMNKRGVISRLVGLSLWMSLVKGASYYIMYANLLNDFFEHRYI